MATSFEKRLEALEARLLYARKGPVAWIAPNAWLHRDEAADVGARLRPKEPKGRDLITVDIRVCRPGRRSLTPAGEPIIDPATPAEVAAQVRILHFERRLSTGADPVPALVGQGLHESDEPAPHVSGMSADQPADDERGSAILNTPEGGDPGFPDPNGSLEPPSHATPSKKKETYHAE
jgi:hypothetical protein